MHPVPQDVHIIRISYVRKVHRGRRGGGRGPCTDACSSCTPYYCTSSTYMVYTSGTWCMDSGHDGVYFFHSSVKPWEALAPSTNIWTSSGHTGDRAGVSPPPPSRHLPFFLSCIHTVHSALYCMYISHCSPILMILKHASFKGVPNGIGMSCVHDTR